MKRVVWKAAMKLKLKLVRNNISLRLDCVKIKKYMYIYIYIVLSHKLWYILLGTEFVFLSCILQVLGGACRSYLITVPCVLVTTDIYCIFSVNFYNKIATMSITVVLGGLIVYVCASSVAICDTVLNSRRQLCFGCYCYYYNVYVVVFHWIVVLMGVWYGYLEHEESS